MKVGAEIGNINVKIPLIDFKNMNACLLQYQSEDLLIVGFE